MADGAISRLDTSRTNDGNSQHQEVVGRDIGENRRVRTAADHLDVNAVADPVASISAQRVDQFCFGDSVVLGQKCRAEHTGGCHENAVCRVAMKGIR